MAAVGEAMAPIGEAMDYAASGAGDYIYDKTGSPALAAAAYSAPTAALELLGLKGVNQLSKSGKLGQPLEFGDIGSGGVGNKQRGIFAGVKAKGADLKRQAAAEELAGRGIGRDQIWQETGWVNDVDGSWKFEIDDSGARVNADIDVTRGVGLEDTTRKGSRAARELDYNELVREGGWTDKKIERLTGLRKDESGRFIDSYKGKENLFTHSDVDRDYPDSKNIRYEVAEGRGSIGGEYRPGSDSITSYTRDRYGEKDISETKSVLLHETQHAIQEREGFARGGNLETLRKDADILGSGATADDLKAAKMLSSISGAAGDDIGRISAKASDRFTQRKGRPPSDIEMWLAKTYSKDYIGDQGNIFKGGDQRGAYQRLAGEAEARNVQTRMDYTPEQRQAAAPWTTLDVPESELIVRGNSKGPMMSVSKAQAIEELEKRGIPMDYDSRMARAKEQGFDTDTVYYHGSRADIESFELGKESREGYENTVGHFFTKSPKDAEAWAKTATNEAAIKEMDRLEALSRSRKKGVTQEQRDTARAKLADMQINLNRGVRLGANITPVYLKKGNTKTVDFKEKNPSDWNPQRTPNEALKKLPKSRDSLDIINYYDRPNWGFDVDLPQQTGIKDPANIRSVNAAFDPADIGKSGLLKSLGGVGLGYQFLSGEDEQNQF
jgi:hypothetical protein